MSEANKEWKLPKNVRQIGEAGSDRKIYVEDYVITFLEKLAEEGKNKKAVLFGEVREWEFLPYIFINGALEVETFYLDSGAREKLQEQIGKYFGTKRIVGWFLASEESPFVMRGEIVDTFRTEFPGENQVLIVRDQEEKETALFMMEDEHPMEQGGYYIYYEKNPSMQEYMISRNDGKSVEQEEPVKDDAIRRFRKIIKNKKKPEKKAAWQPGRMAYLAGSFLAVTVLALGATMVYNYDKMKEVERSLARLTNNVDSQSSYLGDDENAAQVMLHMDNEFELQETEETAKTEDVADGENQNEQTEGTEAPAQSAASANQEDSQTPVQNAASANQEADGQAQEEGGAQTENSEKEVAFIGRASYTVKAGDTLAGISEMYYGNLDKVAEICSLNGIDDENTILPGQKILLP